MERESKSFDETNTALSGSIRRFHNHSLWLRLLPRCAIHIRCGVVQELVVAVRKHRGRERRLGFPPQQFVACNHVKPSSTFSILLPLAIDPIKTGG
jgi:hypothetical protein